VVNHRTKVDNETIWRSYAIALLQFNSHKSFGSYLNKGKKDEKFVLNSRSKILSSVIYDADTLFMAEQMLEQRIALRYREHEKESTINEEELNKND